MSEPQKIIRLRKKQESSRIPAKASLREEIKRISDLQLTLSKRVAQLADVLERPNQGEKTE